MSWGRTENGGSKITVVLAAVRVHFCEITGRINIERLDLGSGVPMNYGLNWLIPCNRFG